MSAYRFIPVSAFFLSFALCACTARVSPSGTMQIQSDDFAPNASIPQEFTCDGSNARPSLRIAGVPVHTQSLAIILEDPDAPTGTFTHWIIWNIDPQTTLIRGTDIPGGSTEGLNGAGSSGYTGPCPPSGTHHYIFRLFAVNSMLHLPATTTVDTLKDALQTTTLAEADMIGLYTSTKQASSASSAETGSGDVNTQPGSTIPTL